MNTLVTAILNEGQWLTISMSLALAGASILLCRLRRSDVPGRRLTLAAMNLFFGITISTMAFGHLLAVTTKLVLGTLHGSAPFFYLIGVALAAPSWWLTLQTKQVLAGDRHRRSTLLLNGWLGTTLVALGPHNLPLAVPAVLNIGYVLHRQRFVGWALLGMAIFVNLGLFIGSLVFLASGKTFEQFRGVN